MAKGSDVRGLHAQDTTREAAIKVLWTRFEDMWGEREGVLKRFDGEAVHDMRVGSRRLRTAMQTFRPCFARKSFKVHSERIKALADLLGEVRDRDVLLDELKADLERLPEDERAGLEGLVDELKAQRKVYREGLKLMLEELEDAAYDRIFLSYLARNT
jgi:CHAD domain-containing protein